ncbi:protein At-4/1-like isoform X1 [Papaver somniferum]|uniref:protein At-4/1-like isoform X1 n=1 Tax=Papaver somniferum TaxID=3469 RepID=UPI000E6FB4F4|nr:protein At-4/1-like isoform X1 [Papaver somniferum]XP_026397769.1 protein At-4/1-like isoform X1 [Papaver somniferum]XP_026397770.1 protein At-4/1-like isoform X1 [Papaver somniferum]
MGATSNEEMETLVFNFDQIYEDFKEGITEIQLLKSNYNSELKHRESLEFTCSNLQSENERLTKMYTESLNKLVYQIENRSKCQSLVEELKKLNDERLVKEDQEHRKEVELLKQVYTKKIEDWDTQIRSYLLQQAANEATIDQQKRELVAHKNQIQALTKRIDWVHSDMESEHHQEIRDLKDWLLLEEEEKKALNNKLQIAEKELLVSRKKLEEQQRDSTSNRHVETLKQKIMKLRKENEALKRQLPKK